MTNAMKIITKVHAITFLTVALSGCISEDPNLEGITIAGGNAIAHNTALQVVDPWPDGVQNTDLAVPANGGSYGEGSGGSTASPETPSAPAEPAVVAND